MDIKALTALNAQRWRVAKLTRPTQFTPVAKRLVGSKARYLEVERATGVPWFIVAVIHEREASGNWNAQLGQGDPLNEVSKHEPKGRGPFIGPKAWYNGAVDALTDCPPYAAQWKDWTAGGALTLTERYNGLAYASHGVPSPYVWSGTDQYKIGKITVDHGPIEPIVDAQLGCAGLLIAMRAIDQSIRFSDDVKSETASIPAPVSPPPPDIEPAQVKPMTWAETIAAIINRFWKGN